MEFINHCNQIQSQGLIRTSEGVPNWRFVGENDDEADVYWNTLSKRWEVRIVICEPNGDIEDYGFNPSEPDLPIDPNLINAILKKSKQEKPTEEIIPIEEPKAGLSKAEIKLREKELEQEDERLELEKAKSKRKDKLLEKYLDGKIDDNTFLEMLKLI
jgi:hypothetical protein